MQTNTNNRKLVKYIEDNGINVKWLASKTGIAYGSLYYIVKGQTKLTLVDAKLIANALNIELDDIAD